MDSKRKFSKEALEKSAQTLADSPLETRERVFVPLPVYCDRLPRLRIGDVLVLDHVEHVVIMVNVCRALCVPLTCNHVTPKTNSDGRVEFVCHGRGISISPNSESPVKFRLSKTEMVERFASASAESVPALTISAGNNSRNQNKMKTKTALKGASLPAAELNRQETTTTAVTVAANGNPPQPAPAKEKPASVKGTLIGRGAMVAQLAASGVPLEEFTKQVRAKYPASSTPWCAKHYKRACAKIVAKAAKTAKVASTAPAPTAPETPAPEKVEAVKAKPDASTPSVKKPDAPAAKPAKKGQKVAKPAKS
jgi:hypothetical protein